MLGWVLNSPLFTYSDNKVSGAFIIIGLIVESTLKFTKLY